MNDTKKRVCYSDMKGVNEDMKYRREYDRKVIGKNLKRLREAKKLSVEDVRQYLRLGTIQAVYKYESGTGYPQADTLLALMELYEAELYDIVDDHDDEETLVKKFKPKKESIEIADYIIIAKEQQKRLYKYYDFYMQKGHPDEKNITYA